MKRYHRSKPRQIQLQSSNYKLRMPVVDSQYRADLNVCTFQCIYAPSFIVCWCIPRTWLSDAELQTNQLPLPFPQHPASILLLRVSRSTDVIIFNIINNPRVCSSANFCWNSIHPSTFYRYKIITRTTEYGTRGDRGAVIYMWFWIQKINSQGRMARKWVGTSKTKKIARFNW